VATFLSQASDETVSEAIESDPDMSFITSKAIESVKQVARLDKTSMDRFQAAKINRLLTKINRRTSTTSDNQTYEAVDRVAAAVVDTDDHPAEFADDALTALREFAAERGYDDVASGGFDQFDT